jgi:hypothetical protein
MFSNFLRRKVIPFLGDVLGPMIKGGMDLAGTDEDVKMLISKVLINNLRQTKSIKKISDAEFKVFSQTGDDGIIQFLINKVRLLPDENRFVEFGVESYRESNTRFLLMNNNWKGLVMEADKDYVNSIKKWKDYWKFDLAAVGVFVTRKNINNLFDKYGFNKNIGLLSIDVDGNDYWLWEAFTLTKPVIVVIEYNSLFGSRSAVTIPYNEEFYRTKAHYSNLYWGTSLKALCNLAKSKGYVFLGSNSSGNNAYFVRKDRKGNLKEVSPESGYVESRYRESRDRDGNLTFLSGKERLNEIKNMKVYDVESNKVYQLKNILV